MIGSHLDGGLINPEQIVEFVFARGSRSLNLEDKEPVVNVGPQLPSQMNQDVHMTDPLEEDESMEEMQSEERTLNGLDDDAQKLEDDEMSEVTAYSPKR